MNELIAVQENISTIEPVLKINGQNIFELNKKELEAFFAEQGIAN